MTWEVICSESRAALAGVADACVDAVVCDPPYDLTAVSRGGSKRSNDPATPFGRHKLQDKGFMGLAWDGTGIAFDPTFWAEVLRVLKPGGHLLAFGGCYDEETEVLTSRGWVRFPSVTKQDDFASLNLETHKVEFQKASEIVRFAHRGPMHRYKTNKVDLLVTPNHKMLTSPLGKKTSWKLVESDKVGRAIRMTKTSVGVSSVRDEDFVLDGVVRGKNRRGGGYPDLPAVKIPQSTWAAFLGIWMAEGHASRSPGRRGGWSTHVAITHFDKKNMSEMRSMLEPFFKVCEYPESGRLRINDPRLYSALKPLGQATTKRIPPYVKKWSIPFLRVFLDWFARGDGDDEGRLYTSSKGLADDIQEIAMYAGWAADISVRPPREKGSKIQGREIRSDNDQFVVRLLKTQIRPQVYGKKGREVRTIVSDEDWGGKEVFCVELPRHHTLYVRRNGKAVWCGNTRTYHRMGCAVEDAGFEIRDSILQPSWVEDPVGLVAWMHGQGFPKSLDVAKAMQKAAGVEPLAVEKATLGMASNPQWNDLNNRLVMPTPEGLAAEWEGFGTALKPAWEPVIVARKPLVGTVVENVLAHGTGVMNIDGCRVGTEQIKTAHNPTIQGGNLVGASEGGAGQDVTYHEGRWPANVVFQHGTVEWYTLAGHLTEEARAAILAYYRVDEALQTLRKANSGDAFAVEEAILLQPGVRWSRKEDGAQGQVDIASMQTLQGQFQGDSVLGSQRQKEVLLQGVSREVLEQRREAEARSSSHSGISSQDARRSHGEVSARELFSVEGGSIQGPERLHPSDGRYSSAGSETSRQEDDQETVSPRTQDHRGSKRGSSSSQDRTGSPQERDKGRQPASQPGDHRQKGSQSSTSYLGARGCSSSTTREVVAGYLEVLPEKIPVGWRGYFIYSRTEECQRVGSRKIKAITGTAAGRMAGNVVGTAYGDYAGSERAGERTGFGDAEGNEDVDVFACVPGCPVRALDDATTRKMHSAGTAREGNFGGDYAATSFNLGENGARPMGRFGDSGGASRFYYQAKPSRREKDLGCAEAGIPPKYRKNDAEKKDPYYNDHPTSKSVSLMRWLVRLVGGKPGSLILDPFMGGGTTGVAAVLEGFSFAGIEREQPYVDIARARITYAEAHREEFEK